MATIHMHPAVTDVKDILKVAAETRTIPFVTMRGRVELRQSLPPKAKTGGHSVFHALLTRTGFIPARHDADPEPPAAA